MQNYVVGPARTSLRRRWIGWLSVAVALSFCVLLTPRPARAEEILNDSTDIAPGSNEALKFGLNYPLNISVSFSSAFTVTIVDEATCDAINRNDQPLSDRLRAGTVYGQSDSGSLNAALPGGIYCLIVNNAGSTTANTQLRLVGER